MNTKQTTMKAVIRNGRTDTNGKAMIFLRITRMGKSSYRSLGLKVKPEYWNSDSGRVRKSHQNYVRMNNQIDVLLREAEERILEEQADNDEIIASMLKASLQRRKVKTIQELIDDKVKELKILKSFNSADKYSVLKNKLYQWNRQTDTPVQHITVEFLLAFEHYMRIKLGNKTNTIHASMKCLRFFCNEAVRFGHLAPEKNPFNLYKLKREATEIPYLTFDQVQEMAQLQLPEDSKMAEHRLAFLFAVDCGGIRISDLMTLKWKNIRGTKIDFKMRKVKRQIAFDLQPTTLKILESLRKPDTTGEDFVFGYLDKKLHVTEEQIHNRIKQMTAIVNSSLKKIGRKMGLDFGLHFHVSRHTFATMALSKGMRIEHVSKILGHANIKETQRYAKIIDLDVSRSMNEMGSIVQMS